jgi:dihydrofolate reductase
MKCQYAPVSLSSDASQRVGSKSAEGTPAHLYSTIEAATHRLLDHHPRPINRTFLIGGASLYAELLAAPPSAPAFVDRVLLTRVLEPSFDDCDVFMPEFDKDEKWKRTEHAELVHWVGSDVPEGVQNENGVKYEFQMWVRS